MNLSDIKGVGEKNIHLLNKLGINNINDLVSYYPRKYQIIKRTNMLNVKDNDKVIIDGIIDGQPIISSITRKLKKITFRITNNTGIYNVLVYNNIYLYKELHYGIKVIVIGKYNKLKNTITADEVRLGELSHVSQIEAIYSTTSGLNQKVLNKIIQNVLNMPFEVDDYIPDYLKEKYKFINKRFSIKEIHSPTSTKNYKYALQRLKYEELFLYLLKIYYNKNINQTDKNAIERKIPEDKIAKFISGLEFKLTIDQEKAVEEIKKDLNSRKRMNRLLQGDVGSGKTIVAFLAMYMNYLSGYQTAMMVPTEILAHQHYNNALELFKNIKINIALLTSSTSLKEKRKIYLDIKNGNIDFVIGTQSLIQDSLQYNNLGLIITDEQHRFGVNQRNELKNKGVFPDILSMSATPIPRTYALTLYGDMDISSIKSKPSGRLDVITYFKLEKDITDILKLMYNELKKKHQIYVIAPAILKEESDSLDNVLLLKSKMTKAFGKVAKIDMIHGKLSNEIKDNVMRNFEKGDINILISTTVIEVGVNVPNASMIVVFNANYFGLSTLHQLRGRVGRGNIQSYCVLVSSVYNEKLKILESINDGFLISEYDFKMRGEGDLFGTRQSGEAFFKLANIKRDFDLLVRVKEDVLEFIENYISNEKYKYLIDYLKNMENIKLRF